MRAPKIPLDTLEEFYEATKVACDEAKNEVCPQHDSGTVLTMQRLSTKSNLKLAKLLLDRKEYTRLHPVGYAIPDL